MGIIGLLAPWIVRDSNWDRELSNIYAFAYFGGMGSSFMVAIGSLVLLSKHPHRDAMQSELVAALAIGVFGVGSAMTVYFLDMM